MYIGQSKDIETRNKKHIKDAYYEKSGTYDTVFHKAIRKYGEESFNIEILCTCKIEDLDRLETYYIKKYNTIMPNGYNMTGGGENPRSCKCKFSEEDIKNIIKELKETDDKAEDIAIRWNCSDSLIKKISYGEQYHIEGEIYPIRDEEHISRIFKKYSIMNTHNPAAKLNVEIVKEIIWDLLNTEIPIKELSKKYNISTDQISRINNGKIWLQVERKIPCRNIKEDNEKRVLIVAEMLLKTNYSTKEIMEKSNYKDRHSISRINCHQIYKDLLKEYPNPIRKL